MTCTPRAHLRWLHLLSLLSSARCDWIIRCALLFILCSRRHRPWHDHFGGDFPDHRKLFLQGFFLLLERSLQLGLRSTSPAQPEHITQSSSFMCATGSKGCLARLMLHCCTTAATACCWAALHVHCLPTTWLQSAAISNASWMYMVIASIVQNRTPGTAKAHRSRS
jgi:hypothetical protein